MNEVSRFLFEDLQIRGAVVRLSDTWRQVIARHDYPDAVLALLGEAIAATVLMQAGLKGGTRVSMQLQGDGPVGFLLTQISDDLKVRGMAQWRPQSDVQGVLLGSGRMAVTLDPGEGGERYQGIVPMESTSLHGCLEDYFRQSEQLDTRLVLHTAGSDGLAGLLLQRLPGADDAEQLPFAEIVARADAVSPEDLRSLPTDALLQRVFPDQSIRLFKPRPVAHDCRCSPAHLASVLRMLGANEIESILDERGEVELTCEFCNRAFNYGPELARILLDPAQAPTLH
jgi:molecular chaperone Hsp33